MTDLRFSLPVWLRRTALTMTAIALGATSLPAQAASESSGSGMNNAARVSGTIRPCWGNLLDAQLRTCGGKTAYRPRGGAGHGPGGASGGLSSATIDCDKASSSYIDDVVRRLRPGATLRLTGHSACRTSFDITRSITIIGQGFGDDMAPTIEAPVGEPCLRISPGADAVVLRNVYLRASRGDSASCIEASGTELTLEHSAIVYDGDASAISLSGGWLTLAANSQIVARTRDVAIDVRNARLFAEQLTVASTHSGIRGTLNGDSEIRYVQLVQLADWHGFERGEGAEGLNIKLSSEDAILSVYQPMIRSFSNGAIISGPGEALLSGGQIDGSNHGLKVSVGRVRLIGLRVQADEIGVDVDAGTAYLKSNVIEGVRTAGILASERGRIRAVDNTVSAAGEDACRTLSWGAVPPEERSCTPWYEEEVFEDPEQISGQIMFDDFRLGVAVP